MLTLRETLNAHNVEELKKRLALLDIKLKAPRKAELVAAMEQQLTGPNLIDTWNILSPDEQAALQEACYTSGYQYDEVRISAKYGSCPRPRKGNQSIWGYHSTNPAPISLFLYSQKYKRNFSIPSDLANSLRKFVTAPEPLKIKTLKEAPSEDGIIVRQTEHEALNDLASFLRLAEQGDFRTTPKTGMPSAAGKKHIRAALGTGDFFPPEVAHKKYWDVELGDIKPIGWVRLFLAAKLVSAGGARSKLTPAGVKALSKPSHETIRLLWRKWLSNADFDEFNRVDSIEGQRAKGHMTAKPPRRKAIAEALLKCPTGEWIDVQKFSSFMRAENLTFEITRNPWKLFICDREYGALGYDGFGGWNMLQFRYLLTFLFEYAATLGLIDIAYTHPEGALNDFSDNWGTDDLPWISRYDGLRAFRITNLGAYVFGLSKDFEATQPETSLQLSISPNLTIQHLSGDIQLSERMLIEAWAEPVKDGLWRLHPLLARDAIERGNKAKDFVTFLEKCDDQMLPQTVEGFLKKAETDAKALKNAGEAIFFDCRDKETADMLSSQKALKSISFRCGETRLAIPAEHHQKFQKHVRKLGLGFA